MENKKLKKTELEKMLAKLSHQDYEVRMRAVEKLGTLLLGKPAPPSLIEMLKDRDELVRVAAAESLGKIGDPKVLSSLWENIENASPLMRRYIAQAIGCLGSDRDAVKLEARLKHEKNKSSRLGFYQALY